MNNVKEVFLYQKGSKGSCIIIFDNGTTIEEEFVSFAVMLDYFKSSPRYRGAELTINGRFKGVITDEESR